MPATPINPEIREHLGALYDQHGVDLVLAGHSHAYERTFPIRDAAVATTDDDPDYVDPPGTIYITTGGGGRVLYPRVTDHPNNEFPAVYAAELHATLLDFDGLEVTGRAINVDGETIDTFTITRTPVASGLDCNANGLRDDCELAAGTSSDCNGNAMPDECETDCNGNDTPDDCDLAAGTSVDADGNDVPDECDADCNGNTIPDSVELAGDASLDDNRNGQVDACEAPLALGLGRPPEPFIVDRGTRAIGFAMTLSVPPGTEDAVLRDARFENVGDGRLADFVEKAELFRDVNGNGVFDSPDQRIGLGPTEPFQRERIDFTGLEARFSPGTETDVFVVLGLNVSAPAASVLLPGGAASRWLLVVLGVALAWLAVRRPAPQRTRSYGARTSWAAGAFLVTGACLFGPGCGGGGGSSHAVDVGANNTDPVLEGSRELQLRLDAFEARTADSDTQVLHEGVPLLGWPFELL